MQSLANPRSRAASTPELAGPPPEDFTVEERLVAFFVRLAHNLGLPRTLGQIYGTLFCSTGPLAFDELTSRSGVSKGAVSQGVRTLMSLRAVRSFTRPNDRRTFFQAEGSMKRLVSNFLLESVQPFIEQGEEELEAISSSLAQSRGASPGSGDDSDLDSKVQSLLRWHAELRRLLPLVSAMAPAAPLDRGER